MQTRNIETTAVTPRVANATTASVDGVDFRKFLSSSSATVIVRSAGAAFSFLMNVFVVRALGAREAGLFFLGQTFLLLFAMVSRFGLDNVLVRFVSTTNDQGQTGAANGVLLKAATISAPLAICVAAITYASAGWIAETILSQPDFQPILGVIAIGIVPFAMFHLISYALQGNKCFVWSMLINAALFPFALLVAAYFPQAFDVDSAIALTNIAIVVALGNAFLAIVVWFCTSDRSVDHKRVTWNQIVVTAFPLFCIALVNYGNTWSPQLVLAGFAEPDQVAILSVSQRTAALLALFLLPVSSVATPTFAALFARNQLAELREFVRRVNGVILLASVPLLTFIFVLAPQVLSIFGPQFAEAKWVLRILILGQLSTAISGSASFLLMVSGNEKSFRNTAAISMVGGLSLAFALVPSIGVMGSAIAGAGSLWIWNSFIWWIVYRKLGINIFRPDFLHAVRLIRRIVT